jgi:ribonuclease HI
MGFIDRACQGHRPVYGVGVVLFLNQKHYLHIIYAPGIGTNNRAEFIALWTLLETAIKKDVKKLQIMGHSKLVIDWARQKISAQDVKLAPLLRDIKLSFQSFEWLYFSHILRELNKKVDELSKEALSLPVGAFGLYKFFEGVETKAMEFCL